MDTDGIKESLNGLGDQLSQQRSCLYGLKNEVRTGLSSLGEQVKINSSFLRAAKRFTLFVAVPVLITSGGALAVTVIRSEERVSDIGVHVDEHRRDPSHDGIHRIETQLSALVVEVREARKALGDRLTELGRRIDRSERERRRRN